MSDTFSFQDQDFGTVTEAVRVAVSSAYAKKGTSVPVSSDVGADSSGDLSAKTTEEILAIRRYERAVSSKTLAFSFS